MRVAQWIRKLCIGETPLQDRTDYARALLHMLKTGVCLQMLSSKTWPDPRDAFHHFVDDHNEVQL